MVMSSIIGRPGAPGYGKIMRKLIDVVAEI